MPKLPGILRLSFIVHCLSFIVLFFSLFTLTLTSAAQAAEPPNPQPCQNAVFDETKLTDNWLTKPGLDGAPSDGSPFITVSKPRVGIPVFFRFEVDFSKLSALFGPANSNYLEGNFQGKDHKAANTSQLNPAGISKFHGTSQKAAPKAMLDPLKVETVRYIYEKNTLAESADIYTDFNGNDPKTIYDMRRIFGEPKPETQRGTNEWENGWGQYWDKIPTTYSEFYEGRIIFKYARGADIQRVINSEYCPPQLPRQITFIMPEFFRTTATTGQLNQVIVPKVAQSDHSNDIVLARNNTTAGQGVLGKIISICSKFLKENPVSNALEKVISRLPKIFNPVSNVYAQEQEGCIRILTPGKEGQDPYCALPAGQLQPPREHCSNQNDRFKQDTQNPNVVCTFYIVIPAEYPAGTYGIWPVFRIPLICDLWNNALYSDEAEPVLGSSCSQVTNRPGVYSWSTPRSVFETEIEALLRKCNPDIDENSDACNEIANILSNPDRRAELGLAEDYPQIDNCFEQNLLFDKPALISCLHNFLSSVEKKRPGETDQDSSNDAKERFVGGVACAGPHQNKNVNFLPKAAQDEFGITNACPLLAVAQLPDTGSGPPGGTPGTFPPTQDNCNGTYALDNPVGNFGDPQCNFSIAVFSQQIAFMDPDNFQNWMAIVAQESGFNPNAYNGSSTSGQAFGLFQMGHAAYPQYGLDYQIADPSTEYDRGDVVWGQQISNAINYNNENLGGSFCYWEAAINLGISQGC